MPRKGRVEGNGQVDAGIGLQMEGLSPSPKPFDGPVEGWRGFTQTGEEADEGSHEPVRSPRLMDPKSHVAYKRLLSSEPVISPPPC